MKPLSLLVLSLLLSAPGWSQTVPLSVKITGEGIDVNKTLKLSDPGGSSAEQRIDFQDATGQRYRLDINHKDLPDNRSYPGNLDVTLRNAADQKLGYLFFANNGVAALQRIGTLGFKVSVDARPVDVRLEFSPSTSGNLRVADLGEERLISDTLVPKFGFQMIRPMLLPQTKKGVRKQGYKLDSHPYAMDFTLLDLDNGLVQFQYNLFAREGEGKTSLLARFYYNADSLANFREGMFAGKYFDPENGTIKLVYYPAMGQTEPPANLRK